MKNVSIRNVLMISVSVFACLNLTTDEEPEPQNSDDDISIPAKIYKCGTEMSDGKICGGVVGTLPTPIETSKNLLTEVSDLPTRFERPKSRQNIFRKGKWALIASQYTDTVVSIDGQFEVDVKVPDIGISTLNWRPKKEIELAYRLSIDGTQEFESDFRKWRADTIPYLRWTKVSSDLIKTLEEGKTLMVSLVTKDDRVLHVDEYSLSGFSENLIAVRKLLKDSPRAEREI